ncbi:MAG: gliding motility protein GldB [Prevotella sp.]|nr:gliding motility protein GldB [Prevotella sp.]MCF0207885.1 gliding motility protein GldB [Bacteroidaceae bacterium]
MKSYVRNITIICAAIIIIALNACDFKKQFMSNGNEAEIKIQRFDRLEYQYLTTGEFSALQQLSINYPIETRTLIEEILHIGRLHNEETNKRFLTFFQDSTLQVLMRDTERQFANMDRLNSDLNEAFHKLRKELPKVPTPTVYSQITALDQSIVIKDGSIGISLDKYLGKDYATYKEFFTSEQRESMTPKMIVPDCILFYIISLYPMKDFEQSTQEQKDFHLGKMLWLTNKIVEFRAYDDAPLKAVEEYLKKHKDITAQELIEEIEFPSPTQSHHHQ